MTLYVKYSRDTSPVCIGFEIGQRILIRFAIRTLFNNKLRTRVQLLSNVFFKSGNRCFQPGTNIRKSVFVNMA